VGDGETGWPTIPAPTRRPRTLARARSPHEADSRWPHRKWSSHITLSSPDASGAVTKTGQWLLRRNKQNYKATS
jgi:hypothetical protein